MKDGISCDGVPWHHRLAPNLDRGDLDSAYIGPTCPSTIPSYPLDHSNHPIGHPTNPIQAIHPLGEHFCHHDRKEKCTTTKHLFWLLLNLECAYNGLRCPRPGKYDCPLCWWSWRTGTTIRKYRFLMQMILLLLLHSGTTLSVWKLQPRKIWMPSVDDQPSRKKKFIALLKMQKACQGGNPIVRFSRTFVGTVQCSLQNYHCLGDYNLKQD